MNQEDSRASPLILIVINLRIIIVSIAREVENVNVSTEIVDGLPHHYEVVDVTVPNTDIILNQCPAYLTVPTPHAHSEEFEEKVDGLSS